MSTKIEKRRNRKIEEAAKKGYWDKVDKLLDQQLNNAERRDRAHNKKSLDMNISREQRKTGLYEVLTNSVNSAESISLEKELIFQCDNALQQLSQVERTIVLARTAEQPVSYAELSRQLNLSDKTVKSYFQKACKKLKSLLIDYYLN